MHSFVIGSDAFDVVTVSGKNAERFLQGQLTCNVCELANNHWTHGACCNNKGRVIAAFVLVRHRDNFHLCMTRGVAPLLIAALQKFLPFYKCTMALQAGSYHLYGLAGECANKVRASCTDSIGSGNTALLQPAGDTQGWLCWLAGANPCALWWSAQPASAVSQLCESVAAGTNAQWEALGLLRGLYPLSWQDSGEYTPQDLHFDASGHVSFNKGCYTGQEIVARMHYRGKPKKQLCVLLLASTPPQDDAKPVLTDATGTTVGTVLLTRPLGERWLALAQLPSDFPAAFDTLACAGQTAVAGCEFDETVIQLSTLFSP